MIIYHGGYQLIETPRIIEGEFAKDFGDGFYCTGLKEQALRCLTFKGSEEVKNERTGR